MRIAFVGNFHVDYSSETHHKKSLEALGHEVVTLQEGVATTSDVLREAMRADMLVWVHTHGWVTPQDGVPLSEVLQRIKDADIPTVTYHLDLWFGLRRQQDLEQDDFYKTIGWFFTVDKQMADWFNENTQVKGRYLPAGVFHEECTYDPDTLKTEQVIFVGSKGYHPEWQYRPKLINWLRETYGKGFTHVGGDGDTGTLRGAQLNNMYAHSKVAVGDSLCLNFDYPYYWSDRVYETMGRGGFIIHPYIEGMGEQFEANKHLVFYDFNNFTQLKDLIDYYLTHDEEREAIRLAGHQHVKDNHTYMHRWKTIIEEVFHA